MTFNEFYDCTMKDYYFELQNIILTGKTLDYIDCDKFWKLFKKAQKDAYNCGLEATKGE